MQLLIKKLDEISKQLQRIADALELSHNLNSEETVNEIHQHLQQYLERADTPVYE